MPAAHSNAAGAGCNELALGRCCGADDDDEYALPLGFTTSLNVQFMKAGLRGVWLLLQRAPCCWYVLLLLTKRDDAYPQVCHSCSVLVTTVWVVKVCEMAARASALCSR